MKKNIIFIVIDGGRVDFAKKSKVYQNLKSKAIFLFSTESVKNIDYILTSEVRYAHSTDYINQLAKLHKFNILRVENTTIRKKVEGQLFILQRLE